MRKPSFPQNSIFFCDGSSCGEHKDLRKKIKQRLKDEDMYDDVEIFKIECSDRCKFAPILSVQPANKWFYEAKKSDINEILDLLR